MTARDFGKLDKWGLIIAVGIGDTKISQHELKDLSELFTSKTMFEREIINLFSEHLENFGEKTLDLRSLHSNPDSLSSTTKKAMNIHDVKTHRMFPTFSQMYWMIDRF